MKSDKDERAQSQNLELRKALNDAYAFVEGQKTAQSFSAVTFEELMDQQIERLVGAGTTFSTVEKKVVTPDTRPNAFDRITKVKNAVIQAVAKIKSMPPEAFVDSNNKKDVNTRK